jgi:NAD(P)H dehydrogenase (quinone)
MNALLVVANPGMSSFSHAMAHVAQEVIARRGGVVRLHDLYEERFDPVQRSGESGNRGSDDELVERHCADLAAADLILVFHPNWWGQPPAIMKGWIDRVFRPGVAYDYPPDTGFDGVPVGLLKAKAALVFNTSNTPREREAATFGDPLQSLWQKCVFGLCGVTRFERRVFGPMASSTAEQRGLWLNDVAALVTAHL